MLHFHTLGEAAKAFKALSSDIRIQIMDILLSEEDKNLNEIAKELHLSNSSVSSHIAILEEADLIEVTSAPGKRGAMKLCRPKHHHIYLEMTEKRPSDKFYFQDVRIGHYTNCSVRPTCGLATHNSFIGELDDPRYFSFPRRFDAHLIWFAFGFVEYSIPNDLKVGDRVTSIEFSFELSSEAPGYMDDYPSDIYFSLNGVPLGFWVSPGDFGSQPGRFNPQWYRQGQNQYGLKKHLVINSHGTFIDWNVKISDTTIHDFDFDHSSAIILRFEAPEDTRHPGGLTIYGTGFGNHNQGIHSRIFYE